jgi:hypothetical protein
VGSYIIAAYGALLLSALIASVEPALGAQQGPPAEPSRTTTSVHSPATVDSVHPAAAIDVDKLPISLDRIREQLDREPAFSLNLLRALGIPIFRVEQRSDLVFRVDPNWWKDDDVGPYVRPTVNRWHYDFMKMVNPDLPTGYGPGGGVDVLPAIRSVFASIRQGSQERERARVRQEIQDELRAINDARRKAGLPPLEQAAPQRNGQTPASNSGNGDPNASSPKSPSNSSPANGTVPPPPPTIKVTPPPPTRPPDPPDPPDPR